MRSVAWQAPQLLPYAKKDVHLDYLGIAADVSNALQTYYQFQERTSATCRISAPAAVLRSLMCQCDNFKGSACDEINSDKSIPAVNSGVSLVCSGFESKLTSFPSTWTFYSDSVTQHGECVKVESEFRSLLYYHSGDVPPLSSVFWFEPKTNDTLITKNENGAVVGVLASCGTNIRIRDNDKRPAILNNVKVCFVQDRPQAEIDPRFTTPDIGVTTHPDSWIIPQGIEMTLQPAEETNTVYIPNSFRATNLTSTKKVYCGHLETFNHNTTYFLVFR